MTGRPLSLLLLTTLLALPLLVHAQEQHCRDGLQTSGDPRNPEVICLPELGRMMPPASPCVRDFGQQIIPLGDIDGDSLADWIISYTRCDTSVFISYDRYPVELLLFHGVRGGLPAQGSGIHIGPDELFTATSVVAVGDFDDDSHTDICCRIAQYGDTSASNDGYDIATLVVFWGQPDGSFSNSDTSQLECGAQRWLGILPSIGRDLTGDGISDLVIQASMYGISNGERVKIAPLQLFCGHRGKRWGREGVTSRAEWRWWNPPPMNSIAAGDQDADGYTDLYLHNNNRSPDNYVSVIYGSATGGLPDTTNVESVNLVVANGKYSLLKDITGDHIPELIVTSGSEYRIKVFIGLRGQRLLDQYGPGHASLDTANPHWWKRPWAEVWEPAKFGTNWPGPYNVLYDLGDINLDGIGDICSFNGPWVTVYRSGVWLDSLIDGMIDCRAAGSKGLDEYPKGIAVLGDIDGSGVPTIAVGINGVLYVKATTDISETGIYRQVPDETGPAAIAPHPQRDTDRNIQLRGIPNPASGDIRLEWNSGYTTGRATLVIHSITGEEIARFSVAPATGHVIWHTDGISDGIYMITLSTDTGRTTTRVVYQHQKP